MNKTLTAPNCLIYIIQQTCFKPHYFNSLIQLYCIHKQVSGYITTDRAKQKVHIFADTKN